MAYEQLKEKYQHLETERGDNGKVQEIKDHFADNGMEGGFDDVNHKELAKEPPPEKPQFPIFMFSATMIKSLLDLADISGIGAIFTTITSFIIAVILFVWSLNKVSGGYRGKPLNGFIWKRYGLSMIIEFIPLIKIIPADVLFVLSVYFREKKVVKMFSFAHGKLGGKKKE